MQYMANMSGSSAVIKKYKMSATGYIVGIVMLRAAGAAAGQVSVSTTTSMAEAMGLSLDLGSKRGGGDSAYSTVQATLATDGEGVISVITNPDMIIRALMVTGATGTALTADAVLSADSTGLTVVGTETKVDEGMVWYTSGANVGQSRKIESISSGTATVVVPFAANAVGDGHLATALQIGFRGWTTTTDLTKLRNDVATTTACRCAVLDFELVGRTDSYAHIMLTDMAVNPIGA